LGEGVRSRRKSIVVCNAPCSADLKGIKRGAKTRGGGIDIFRRKDRRFKGGNASQMKQPCDARTPSSPDCGPSGGDERGGGKGRTRQRRGWKGRYNYAINSNCGKNSQPTQGKKRLRKVARDRRVLRKLGDAADLWLRSRTIFPALESGGTKRTENLKAIKERKTSLDEKEVRIDCYDD